MYVSDFNERMDKAFLDIKRRSYSTQYRAQYDIGGLRVFHIPFSEGRDTHTPDVDTNIQRRRFDAKMALITTHTRAVFRRSPFYKNKELTYTSVADNAHIFPRAFLVFVNGKLIDRVTALPKEDITCFFIKKDVVKQGDIISIVFTPNYKHGVLKNKYIDIKQNIEYMSYNDVLKTKLTDETTYMTFIGNSVPPKEQDKIDLNSTIFKPLAIDNENIFLNIFGFRHLSDIIKVETTNLFSRIKRMMPVPKENLLIFEKRLGGQYTLSLNAKIKYYYPDVFEIVETVPSTDVEHYLIYVFYNTEYDQHVLPYNEQLEKLSELLNFSPEDYGTDLVHPLMRDFVPDPFIYSIQDMNLDSTQSTLEYKMKQMVHTLRDDFPGFGDPGMLREYLKYRHRVTNLMQINMKDIDMKSKERLDTSQDVKYPEETVVFDDVQLVFIFKNEDQHRFLSLRFYVDGVMYMYTHRWKRDAYEYYYLPMKHFRPDSVLDIESFDTFSEVFMVNLVNKNSVKEIEYTENTYTNDDIFMIDKETNKFLVQGKTGDFVIKLKNPDGSYTTLDDHSYEVINEGKFYVSIINDQYLGRDLLLYIQRGDMMVQHEIEEDTYDNTFTFKERFSPHKEQIRVHRNGRFLPPYIYSITLPDKYGDTTTVHPGVMGYKGDNYIVDITPVHYNVVHQMDQIPEDGFLNLLGILDKPLSFQWYDFYMNGRKLTTRNIQFISPFILTFWHLRSMKNFVIIEKDRSTNIFDLRTIIPNGDIVHKILELNPQYKKEIGDIDKDNLDVEDSIIGEIIDSKFQEMIDFFENEYEDDEIRMIHPGSTKIKKHWPVKYPLLFNDDNIFIIEPKEVITGNQAHMVRLHPSRKL